VFCQAIVRGNRSVRVVAGDNALADKLPSGQRKRAKDPMSVTMAHSLLKSVGARLEHL